MTIAALVAVIGVVIAGAATATTRYIISSLSQISPGVVRQLGPPDAAVVATGHVTPLGANARVAALSLRWPAAVSGTVLLVNNGSSDVDVTCSIHLGATQISPGVKATVPAADSNPLGGSSADNVTVPLAAATAGRGTLSIVCNPSSTSNTLVADSTLTAVSANSVAFLTPKATASTSPSASPSTSASTSPSPSSSTSGSASPSTSTSGSASPSSSSSSSCGLPVCP
jgi:hypothetical protein